MTTPNSVRIFAKFKSRLRIKLGIDKVSLLWEKLNNEPLVCKLVTNLFGVWADPGCNLQNSHMHGLFLCEICTVWWTLMSWETEPKNSKKHPRTLFGNRCVVDKAPRVKSLPQTYPNHVLETFKHRPWLYLLSSIPN